MPLESLKRFFGGAKPAAEDSAASHLAAAHAAAGRRAEREGCFEAACEHYRAALRAAPADPRAHLDLAAALEALGCTEEALRSYRDALALAPEDAYANYNVGRLLYARGEARQAEPLLQRALAVKPDFPEAQVVLAGVLEARGEPIEAARRLEAALALRPNWAGALGNYAQLLVRLGRFAEAQAALERAVSAANDAGLLLRLGGLLLDHGRFEQAADCCRRALALDPDSLDARLDLAAALALAYRGEEALEHARQAAQRRPDSPEAHFVLGSVLRDLGRRDEAIASLRRAVAERPDHAEARWAFAMATIPPIPASEEERLRARRDFARELEALETWMDAGHAARCADAVGTQTPFYLAYHEEDNRELLERHGRLCARAMAAWLERERCERAGGRSAGSPLRVGVVSRHLRAHPVWNALVKGWFRGFDPERIALLAFDLAPESDAETEFARARAARFEKGVRPLKQWVETIVRERPDVLLYPEIGMDPLALKLASLRLAPVQATSWGHPETSGLPTIDYFLSAELLEPSGAAARYSERVVLLPGLGCAPEPARAATAALAQPAVSVPEAPLLLCPGQPFKYAPRYDRIWVEIARRLGRCRLIFFEHWTGLSRLLRERLAREFDRAGLRMEDFVSFIPWQSAPAFHTLAARADAVLDTIGFSGFNTALQALECGTPVITRRGRFLRGQLAAGILERIGLPQLIAENEEDYIALAVRIATDADQRAALSAAIARQRALAFDDPRPVRALQEFLERAVRC